MLLRPTYDDLADRAKELSIMLRRFFQRRVALHACNQRAHVLKIASRKCCREAGKRVFASQQFVSPALDLPQLCRLALAGTVPLLETRAYRSSIHFTHELADELHLPAPTFEIAYALCIFDRLAQPFGKIELAQLIGAEQHKPRTDVL